MIDEIGASTGGGTPGGRDWPTSWSFSVTICRAWKMSVPHSNSTQTMLNPWAVEERILRTPVAPFTDVSIGNVTSVSTSSGPIPCASVRTVTVGAVKSGNTSTGIRNAVTVPEMSRTPAATATSSRLRMDQRITPRTMVRS